MIGTLVHLISPGSSISQDAAESTNRAEQTGLPFDVLFEIYFGLLLSTLGAVYGAGTFKPVDGMVHLNSLLVDDALFIPKYRLLNYRARYVYERIKKDSMRAKGKIIKMKNRKIKL